LRAFARIARIGDASNIAENVGQTCWLEVHHSRRTRQSLRELGHSAVTHCADIAQFLGQNYIRLHFSQKRFVDCVNAAVVMQRTAHPFIHVPTRQFRTVHSTTGDARPLVRFRRKIALMRNANDLVHQPKRSRYFGRSR
jgi:hypothetical protein